VVREPLPLCRRRVASRGRRALPDREICSARPDIARPGDREHFIVSPVTRTARSADGDRGECARALPALVAPQGLRGLGPAVKKIALIIAVASAIVWAALGANRGWTKTSVPKKTLDEVTGIEGVSYEKRFLPGVDFLGVALLASGFLAGASFLFQN